MNKFCCKLKARFFMIKKNNLNSRPCIICVAITGSVPTKDDNPNLPTSVNEQIESTQEAYESGASIAHCHVRNDDQSPTSDPNKFALLFDGLKRFCPNMVVQFSTGGRSGNGFERGGMLSLSPDMASLAVGSNNFPTRVYENHPDLVNWLAKEMLTHNIKPEIEAFDLSHIHQAKRLYDEGLIKETPYIQFVMGVKNAMPVDRDVFNYYVKTVRRLLPKSEWCAAGIGKFQKVVNDWSIKAGGHTRTGLEDNIRLNKKRLAPSNAALVKMVVDMCEKYERPIATCQDTRKILNLSS